MSPPSSSLIATANTTQSGNEKTNPTAASSASNVRLAVAARRLVDVGAKVCTLTLTGVATTRSAAEDTVHYSRLGHMCALLARDLCLAERGWANLAKQVHVFRDLACAI